MNVFGVKVFAYLELVKRNVTSSFWGNKTKQTKFYLELQVSTNRTKLQKVYNLNTFRHYRI
jgi:hypothetical protein